MSRHDAGYIDDILLAASRLAEVVAGGRRAFDQSWLLRSAAERQLEIIGEAAGSLSEQLRARHPEVPFGRARGMRNVISHQYRNVDYGQVWRVMAVDVPEFAAMIAPLAPEPREQSQRRRREGMD